jgi:hypothetical protein
MMPVVMPPTMILIGMGRAESGSVIAMRPIVPLVVVIPITVRVADRDIADIEADDRGVRADGAEHDTNRKSRAGKNFGFHLASFRNRVEMLNNVSSAFLVPSSKSQADRRVGNCRKGKVRPGTTAQNQSPFCALRQNGKKGNSMRLILLIILIILLIGALPLWPYSAGWGYYPGSGLGLVLLIVIILVVIGRL